LTLADILAMSQCRTPLAAGRSHWTETVYLINGGIVAVFFLVVFGAIASASIKWTWKRLVGRKKPTASAGPAGAPPVAPDEDSE
jgi:hypothetical protein